VKREDLIERFGRELEDIGGVFVHCKAEDVGRRMITRLTQRGVERLISWDEQGTIATLTQFLREEGFVIIDPHLPQGSRSDRADRLAELGTADAGLTGAVAGIAETGTLIVPGGDKRSQLASLLVPVHFAILQVEDIYRSMETWLTIKGGELFGGSACINLISGPSRTADIEMTLTIGVHGPGEVVVFCVD
jgi:L-lactate dehydrogenase complex protein LldG